METALLARIEFLEAQLEKLKFTDHKKSQPFNIDQIKHNDHLISFYTGFPSFDLFLEFYQFLGPAVDKLHYWGTKPDARKRHRSTKLTPMDQLFMTLVKLRSLLIWPSNLIFPLGWFQDILILEYAFCTTTLKK